MLYASNFVVVVVVDVLVMFAELNELNARVAVLREKRYHVLWSCSLSLYIYK